MKTHLPCHVWVSALTGVTLLLAACPPRQGSDSHDVMAAVDAIWTRYSSSYNAGDLDSWLSLWTDDGVQMPPGERPVGGKDQIRARNKGVLGKAIAIDGEYMTILQRQPDGSWKIQRDIFNSNAPTQ